MAQNRSLFLEGLQRTESRRDGGFRQFKEWRFSEESEDSANNSSSVSMEEGDRQNATFPEENKSPPARHFDPHRTYEHRAHSSRPVHRLGPKKHADSPMSNRTNVFIISPTPSQGIVIQGRTFQHAQLPTTTRRQLVRDFPPTQRPPESDSIVLTCPEAADDSLNLKRRVPQRRKPLQDCYTFPSPPELSWPSPFPLICLHCKRPKEPTQKCTNCGSAPSPQPPIRLMPHAAPLQGLQPGLYRAPPRTPPTLPPRVTRTNRSGAARELNDPIVLSSDEDEEAENASTGSSRLDSVSPRPADSAHSSPAPSGGKVEAAVKNAAELDEANGDFLDDVELKISIPRRARMKDQFGNSPVEPRLKKPKLPSKCSSIILECRSMRIGSLRRVVRKPVVFTTEHIQLETEGVGGQPETVVFRSSELVGCEWCSVRKLPVLFFQSTEPECDRIRAQLRMSREPGGDWLDCSSQHPDERYIVLIFENGLPMEQQVILEDILAEIGQNNNVSDFPVKISFDEANLRLVNYNKATERKDDKGKSVKTPPKAVTAPNVRTRMSTRQKPEAFESDDETSEIQTTFTGPALKLMVYPPPPATGGIAVTTEDLHCLNDGEFLNDVIIDFYLKYLVLERLKKEDAQRIHVFSSFFYKRLNQRERRCGADPSNLPIQKKKHNRVKTWTRHVDLFQKDFIFVPINESAHWYLAVICFPGLQNQVLEPNPCFQGESVSPPPQTEEPSSDHCRPLSPVPSPSERRARRGRVRTRREQPRPDVQQ
uniref:Ubiquitin-like protease family profile domain-containing protein n=1 Tax=Neogobius melanostomus TaxID=47308 RepID=A0A8C6TYB7_9GOBI